MGTNFYFSTRNKRIAHRFEHYELCNRPDFHYEIHLAKTSAGWLPLFQAHKGIIQSVQDIERLYNEFKSNLAIIDEEGRSYDWPQFKCRVLDFNGGVSGRAPRVPYHQDPDDRFYDPKMPEYLPVSHFDYAQRSSSLFKDAEGYEFESCSFS